MKNNRRISGVALDVADHQILTALSGNARISMADLGRLIGMSAQSAADRARRLEDPGRDFGLYGEAPIMWRWASPSAPI